MKTRLLALLLIFPALLMAQTTKDYAVMIKVTVQESPATLTLNWNKDSTCTSQLVYRKQKAEKLWGTPLATLGSAAMQYADQNVQAGKTYEYYVRRIYASRVAHGYVYAGVNVPEVTQKGKMLLLVDQNYVVPLAAEIIQLTNDLIGDGWTVQRVDVDRSLSVKTVKGIITGAYAADHSLQALYLLGRIPVPYSGAFSTTGSYYPPDGHPDHGGAWPADLYYGTLNESIWTDNVVNDVTPSRVQNDNIPGDGKFDLVYIYNDTVAFQIGRVDLTDMPQFGKSDTLLVKQYLNKAHAYKTGNTPVVRRGLIDDNFGAMGGEAFASTAWRDFSVMFGDSVFGNRDYLTATKQGNYLFSYGCGGGTYTSAGGIGNTSNFNNDSINTIFTALFGSYFGDWDATNSFLRAPLCEQTTLTSAWSGRPYWMFHHMALGENIGYSSRIAQNNYSDFGQGGTLGYAYNTAPTFIHIALMGDPSLRLHTLKPVTGVNATRDADSIKVHLTWTASTDAEFYIVLRSGAFNSAYKQISTRLAAGTLSFTDSLPNTGMNYYQVRAVKLEQTPSGTYYNMSLAANDSAYSFNPSGVVEKIEQLFNVEVFPNPNNGNFFVTMSNTDHPVKITCYDVTGKVIAQNQAHSGLEQMQLNGYTGLVLVMIESGGKVVVKKVLVTGN